ncbi:hypothetical protein ACIQ9K_38795 [Streptomyces microflavus]|uniref:hypothetical protein n=1 Tax=Streptomyces microflavus TaxID=1919 RepID=UPI0038266A42
MTGTSNRRVASSADRGLPPWAFAALMLGAFTIVAAFVLLGGWPGLIGIAITAVVLIGFAATRL